MRGLKAPQVTHPRGGGVVWALLLADRISMEAETRDAEQPRSVPVEPGDPGPNVGAMSDAELERFIRQPTNRGELERRIRSGGGHAAEAIRAAEASPSGRPIARRSMGHSGPGRAGEHRRHPP
jgi:hypothetical protein